MKIYFALFFLFIFVFLGIGGCSNMKDKVVLEDDIQNNNVYDVVIIGAGASGLSAAKLLEEYNKSYIILEASERYGGRMKKLENFSDFPIDLGAEWIHHELDLFKDLTRNDSFDVSEYTITYNPKELYLTNSQSLEDMSYLAEEYEEYKFKNITWFDFFEKFMITNSIRDSIKLNSPVTSINYSSDNVLIKTANGEEYYSRKVLVTVPISVLQKEYIEFSPKFSNKRVEALQKFNFSPGFKAFLKFSDKFYPDLVEFESSEQVNSYEEKTFYDATFNKQSQDNVLGVLVVGSYYEKYEGMNETEIIDTLISEIDVLSDGLGSEYFEEGVVQYWSGIKYIEGTYVTNSDELGVYLATDTIREPIDDKIYFSGSAYHVDYQGTVSGATLSAYAAVDEMYG